MLELTKLQKIHTPDEYYEHGQALLSEDADYYDHYLSWVKDNEEVLKTQYIKLLVQNDNEILDVSFLEWAMTSYVVYDYNRVKSEIDDLLN